MQEGRQSSRNVIPSIIRGSALPSVGLFHWPKMSGWARSVDNSVYWPSMTHSGRIGPSNQVLQPTC